MAGADPRDRSDTADRTDAGLSSGSDCFVVCVGALPAWPLSRRLIPVAAQGGARWTIWSRLPSGARPREHEAPGAREARTSHELSLIHISEPTRLGMISYAVFCLK